MVPQVEVEVRAGGRGGGIHVTHSMGVEEEGEGLEVTCARPFVLTYSTPD